MELPGGNYRVLFRLKVSDNTRSEPIAKLYVKATRAGSERELAHFILRPIHFSQAKTWEVFELPVEIRDNDTNVKIGVEFYGGVADLWCDWIRAVPAGTAVAGDLRILGALKAEGKLDLMGAHLARPMLQPLGNLVFAETFDRYTDPSELDANWDVVARTSTITFEPGFGGLGQSIRSQDTEGGLGLTLTKYIPATPVVVVRLMYKARSNQFNMAFGIPSFLGDGALHTHQAYGQIGYDAPDGTRKWICTIPLNEWIELLWYVDIRAGKFKLWVNGDYIGEFNVTQAGTYIDRIRFRSNYNSTEDYEIDNIQVWIPASVKHELAGSLNIEALRIKGTEIIDASRNIKNVSADAGIITSGTFALDRIPVLPTEKIADRAITTAKLASGAVTADKIADGAVDLAGPKVTGQLPYYRTDFANQDLRTTASPKFAGLDLQKGHILNVRLIAGQDIYFPVIPTLNNKLAFFTKWGTVTVSPEPTSGTMDNCFDGDLQKAAVWDTTAVALPITITLDLRQNISYWTIFGLYFTWGDWPKSVTIEYYHDDDLDGVYEWEVVYSTTTGGKVIYTTATRRNIRKIRITLDNPNSAKIRLAQIFGAWFHEERGFFLRRDGDKMYGTLHLDWDEAEIKFGPDISLKRALGILKADVPFDASALRVGGIEIVDELRNLKNVAANGDILNDESVPASKLEYNVGTTGDRILVSSDTMYETTSTSWQLAWEVQVEALEDVKNIIEYVKAQIRVGPSGGGGAPPPPGSETECNI